MRFRFLSLFSMLLGLAIPQGSTPAKDPPSFFKQVKPFLNRYCLECHNSMLLKGGLDMESYASLIEGADSGPVVEPGKPDKSKLVLLAERKEEPYMPPKKARQPKAAEVAVLRAWVAAGARDDTGKTKAQIPNIRPRVPVAAAVAALAFRPDGKLLAAAGHREVILIDPVFGDVVGKLPGQKAKVTALAFSKDSKVLAAASGTSGSIGEVRIYSVPAQGLPASKPDFVLEGHKDIILDVAFSPDGKFLATCGYDRLIKVWDVAGGKEIHTLKDHSDSVYGVAFSPDGKLLASGSADRAVKVWQVATGRRLYTLGESTDWIYAVAWAPDGRHLAGAGVDKSIRVWEVSAGEGRLAQSVFAHEGAVTRLIYSADGKTLYSLGEDRHVKSWDTARMVERKVYARQPEEVLALALPADRKQLALGRYDGAVLLLDEATGKVLSEPMLFTFVAEVEPNDSPTTGQKIALPASIAGSIGKPGDVDFYRFEARAGEQIGVQALTAAVGSRLDPALKLVDDAGQIVAESDNGLLGYTCPRAGSYALGIRDKEFRGEAGMHYRLHVGPIPIVTAMFPLGLQRGTETEIHLEGVHLGTTKSVRVKAPAEAAPGMRLPLAVPLSGRAPLGMTQAVVGEFPEAAWETAKPALLAVPGTGNGRIDKAGATQTWRFRAKKGQRLILEVAARRLGARLDSYIEILDGTGRPVPRATLRCLAKTYVTFRDHDSVGSGIRLESWSELAIDDYILVGPELLRIHTLPKNPDDDCQFYSDRGQRLGFLGTTPTHHSNNTPMYKVAIHPAGTTFPPNGFPVVTLYYRNDDGGPGYGKDSRLTFDPPADGDYQVCIGDSRGAGGSAYSYRLTVRPPRPSFTVSFSPTSPAVWKGGAVPINVTCVRTDGFSDPIDIRLENVPKGFSAPATTIPAGENSTTFALWAEPTAATPSKVPALKLVARARINGKDVVREVMGGLPAALEPGDLITTTEQSEVTVKPGKQVFVRVKVERRSGFKGRIPLDVRGLPHGVRVLDIGLNGILITELESTRTVAIYCEPWVKPTTHPFVVLSRSERKGTEHAARSVLLIVTGK